MTDFDLATLEQLFDLVPEAICPNCNSIIPARDEEYVHWQEGKTTREEWESMGGPQLYGYTYDEIDPRSGEFKCLVCGERWQNYHYFEYPFEHDEFLVHLAGIASSLKAFPPFVNYGLIDPARIPSGGASLEFAAHGLAKQIVNVDPYDALVGACEKAKWRVHFMTWTVDEDFIVELRQLAEKNGITVRGIVGKEHRKGKGRLTSEIGPHFSLLVAKDPDTALLYSHTKLVIIDGVAAIKGSANLRRDSFRAMAETPPKELIEAVTSVRQAQALNNRIFAPVWAGLMQKYNELRRP